MSSRPRAKPESRDPGPHVRGWSPLRHRSVYALPFPESYGIIPIMTVRSSKPEPRPLFWVASARKDLGTFPAAAQREVGYALYLSQIGARHVSAKALKGFGDAGVLEIVTSVEGDTYRTVYTVRFSMAVYVLHAFQKKSKAGVTTPRHDIELVRTRLRDAKAHHDRMSGEDE